MSRFRTRAVAVAATLAIGAGTLAGLGSTVSVASSHREAPLTSADPRIDQTDLYVFRSPDKPDTVSFVSSWIPFQEPAGGPNFYLWAEKTNYDINIDNDGDALADVIYRWRFTTHTRNGDTFLYNTGQVTSLNDPDLNVYQTYDLMRIRESGRTRRLLNDRPVVPSYVGDASMPDYAGDLFYAGIRKDGDTWSWVGQSDDPFFLDLRVFDLLYGTDLSEVGDDTLAGFNVNTIALQVPIPRVQGDDDPVIGVWNTASRPSTRIENGDGTQRYLGDNVQVSRLGSPLVNEVVVPLAFKDYFNSSDPRGDAVYLPKVNDPELPYLLNLIYSGAFPTIPDSDPDTDGIQRADLVQVFLTGVPGLNKPAGVRKAEMLRLNLETELCGTGGAPACSTLGVLGGDFQGFPNGRRLSDDTIDIALRAVMGVLLPDPDPAAETLGDLVDANEVAFNSTFPYVAEPHSGSDDDPH